MNTKSEPLITLDLFSMNWPLKKNWTVVGIETDKHNKMLKLMLTASTFMCISINIANVKLSS